MSGKPTYEELEHRVKELEEEAIKLRQAIEALAESEKLYKPLVETTKAIVWEVDLKTLRFNYISPQVGDITGYLSEMWIDFDFWASHIHPEDKEYAVSFCQAETAKGKDHEFEYRMKAADGSILWIQDLVTVVKKEGKPISLRGNMIDITERKHIEETLRESEERFKQAMEANRDGLWDWNVNTDEVYYSPGYAAMLGYTTSELPAHVSSWKDLIHPEDKEAALKVNMDCIENRRDDFEVEFRMQAKNGEWRWILGRGKAVVRDSNGRAIRMVGTHTDITDRKRAAKALRESEKKFRLLIKNLPSIVYQGYKDWSVEFIDKKVES